MGNVINYLCEIAKPTGLWESILFWLDGLIGSYGWAIIIFTVMIKVILSPTDFFIKYSSKKTSLIQKKLSPQIQKLQTKYKNDQTALNTQLNALYKKEGLNMISSCLIMLGNIILTLVIFITIFSSMRNIAAYKVINQYEILHDTYYTTLNNTEGTEVEKKASAEEAVIEKYSVIKDDWLWVKSIWRPDTWVNSIPTANELTDMVKNSSKTYKTYVAENINNEETGKTIEYEAVMSPIREVNSGWNGYLIMIVLVGLLSYLSQVVSDRSQKVSGVNNSIQTGQAVPSMKILKIVMPLLMISFVFSSNTAFGIYLFTSSLVSMVLGLIINKLTSKATAKLEEETRLVLLKQQDKLNKR